MTAEQIAAGLTKAQREAVINAVWSQPLASCAGRWEVKTPRIWRAIADKGLGYKTGPVLRWRPNKDCDRTALNELGLEVRAILMKEQTDARSE